VKPLTLMAFAPMIDSELARLILGHYAIDYQENDHQFGWVSLLTLFHGGFGQVPLLYGQHLHLTSPRAIVDYFDAKVAPERRLLPSTQPERQEMEAYWTQINEQLGFDPAVVSYFYLLPDSELMIRTFARRIPHWEAKLLPAYYGTLRLLFTVLLKLGPGQASDALSRIRSLFDQTDKRLAKNSYLVGERLTLADLKLISFAAPLLLPGGSYAAPMPNLDEMPPDFQAIVRELREHPTAAFVMRFYASQPATPVPDYQDSNVSTFDHLGETAPK
jgi:glutathione S-transferase